jgi:hypothetical protein
VIGIPSEVLVGDALTSGDNGLALWRAAVD